MVVEAVTVSLLNSVLSSPEIRNAFMRIAKQRIVDAANLKGENAPENSGLEELQAADLIDFSPTSEKYFVTAKGLKVARDLQKIPAF